MAFHQLSGTGSHCTNYVSQPGLREVALRSSVYEKQGVGLLPAIASHWTDDRVAGNHRPKSGIRRTNGPNGLDPRR